MPSQWLAVAPGMDPRVRARQLRQSWERLLAGRELESDAPAGAAAEVRQAIVDSWKRSLDTGLDPVDLLAPLEADRTEMRERWAEHPLGSLVHVLLDQLEDIAGESQSLIVVSDASGLLLHIEGPEMLRVRAAEMNFVEGALYSEAAAGTNGIGTVLAADHALQVFASEHFNQRHHGWTCSGAPVHDPDPVESSESSTSRALGRQSTRLAWSSRPRLPGRSSSASRMPDATATLGCDGATPISRRGQRIYS